MSTIPSVDTSCVGLRDHRAADQDRPLLAALNEFALFIGAFLAYFGVRGLIAGRVEIAESNARAIVAFERAVGVYVEPALQSVVAGSQSATTLANWVYLWGHWPVIIGVGLWLFRTHRSAYRRYRNALIISGAIGFVLFATFPVAPPRLMDLGFVDTVTEQARWYRIMQPPALTNQYAAFPSFHFGWNLLIGIALVANADRRWLRAFGLVMPAAMLAAIVVTANHYVVDALAGGTIALAGLGLAGLSARSLRPALQRVRSGSMLGSAPLQTRLAERRGANARRAVATGPRHLDSPPATSWAMPRAPRRLGPVRGAAPPPTAPAIEEVARAVGHPRTTRPHRSPRVADLSGPR